jgi:hypothetical protein
MQAIESEGERKGWFVKDRRQTEKKSGRDNERKIRIKIIYNWISN